jgi:hypothetical protein
MFPLVGYLLATISNFEVPLHAPFSPRLAATLELLFQKPVGIPLCEALDLSGSGKRVFRAPSVELSSRTRAPLGPSQSHPSP